MNADELHKYRSDLENRISELMQQWALDNALFWAEHSEITIQAAPFHFDAGHGPMVTFSEHERALRSIATHVMDGRGFSWNIDMMTDGTGYFWIGVYNGEDDVRRD